MMNKGTMLDGEEKILDVNIHTQPDDVTCGATCLQGIYQFYGDNMQLNQVINEVVQLSSGGTLAVLLGIHALKRGYEATIYTYNLNVFDPSWFKNGIDLSQKLIGQLAAKPHKENLKTPTEAYLTFLAMGGKIKYKELTPSLIKSYLSKEVPILTGLSATYLYDTPRELGDIDIVFDDLKGEPAGHFVLVNGYDSRNRLVSIADPVRSNPISDQQYYKVSFQKIIASIMLGVMTYDANLLMIYPKGQIKK